MFTSQFKGDEKGGKSMPPSFFQAKLTVNTPGDAHEQEADRVADQVMRMQTGDQPVLQQMRVSSLTGIQRKCRDCEKEEKEHVMRKEQHSGSAGASAPAVVSNVLSSGGGHPLDSGTRTFMENRFGQDFGQVRVHTDEKSAESARAIHARAYTNGQNIVFGPGQYQPESSTGRHLLAHELTHVEQQKTSDSQGAVQRDGDGKEGDKKKEVEVIPATAIKDPKTEVSVGETAEEKAGEGLTKTAGKETNATETEYKGGYKFDLPRSLSFGAGAGATQNNFGQAPTRAFAYINVGGEFKPFRWLHTEGNLELKSDLANNVAVSVDAKLLFLPNAKISPYLAGGYDFSDGGKFSVKAGLDVKLPGGALLRPELFPMFGPGNKIRPGGGVGVVIPF
jgi:hypothetical protein